MSFEDAQEISFNNKKEPGGKEIMFSVYFKSAKKISFKDEKEISFREKEGDLLLLCKQTEANLAPSGEHILSIFSCANNPNMGAPESTAYFTCYFVSVHQHSCVCFYPDTLIFLSHSHHQFFPLSLKTVSAAASPTV